MLRTNRRSAWAGLHGGGVRLAVLLASWLVLSACGGGGGVEVRAVANADATVFVGESATVDGRASMPDDGTLRYAWSFESRPARSEAAFADPEAARTSFVADVEGRYVVALGVEHDAGWNRTTVAVEADLAASVRLEGDRNDPALGATYDLDVPARYADDAYERDTSGDRDALVLRREIEVAFRLDATVGEVNDLLDDLGGGIVSMLRGVPIVVVQIPDPGDLAGLQRLLSDLEADDRVAFASATYVVDEPEPIEAEEEGASIDPAAIPPDADPTDQTRTRRIDHHLAVRGHAAWNVAGAIVPLADRPWIVIQDSFGDDTPTDGYDIDAEDGDFGDGASQRHGYHVLGIVAGAFDPPGSVSTQGRSDVTGMMPARLQVRAVDGRTTAANTWARRTNQVIQRMNAILDDDPDANVVVTSSQNSRGLGLSGTRSEAARWVVKVRLGREFVNTYNVLSLLTTEGSGLESRFVHTTSAGNANRVTGGGFTRWPASDNSVYTYAALGDDLRFFGIDLPPLVNVHVIENRRHARYRSPSDDRPAPQCVTNSSIVGGTLGAPGVSIWSMGRCTATNAAGRCTTSDGQGASAIGGTSMSTPQVAGLAALAWSLNPALTTAQVVALLRDTAVDDGITTGTGCNATVTDPAPVIDAYAAVLQAGGVDAWRAVLDVNDDGSFDGADLDAWLDALAAFDGNRTYGRFDLNGDGGVGYENRTERVDLNGDGVYGSVTRSIVGDSVSYDETAVSDLDALCYHAYGPAYEGTNASRPALLRTLCSDAVVEITQPADGSETIGGSVDLRAQMRSYRPDGWLPDPTLYRIVWYEELDTGARRYLGTTESGELLTADLACRDARIEARAQHRNVPRFSRDAVQVTRRGAGLGPWVPSATPDAAYLKLSVNVDSEVRLSGRFDRDTCAGAEIMSGSDTQWVDDDAEAVVASGATLIVRSSDVTGGRRTYRFESRLATETVLRTVVPCSVFAEFTSGSGLVPCSSPTSGATFQDAIDRYYGDLEEARRIKEILDRGLDEGFLGGVPDPFPKPLGELVSFEGGIGAAIGGADWEVVSPWFTDLTDLLTNPNVATFPDDLVDLEAIALEQATTFGSEALLDLFLASTSSARVTFDLYAPISEGGRDVAADMPFLSPEERDQLRDQRVTLAQHAVEGQLTGFLETHVPADGGGLGTYDEALSLEAGVIGGMGGALKATGFLDPFWPHD